MLPKRRNVISPTPYEPVIYKVGEGQKEGKREEALSKTIRSFVNHPVAKWSPVWYRVGATFGRG
jgi:hypothetical protein